MRKSIALLLVGVILGAVTVYALDYVTVKVLFEQTTVWPIVWRNIAEMKGLTPAGMTGAQRKAMVSEYMRDAIIEDILAHINTVLSADANSQAAAQAAEILAGSQSTGD